MFTDSNLLASIFVAIACFGMQIQVPAWWASATQVSGRHLGALFGMMNMLGAVGGICSQIFLGRFADWMKGLGYTGRAQWDPGFYVYVAVALIGMVLWSLIDPEKTVDSRHASAASRATLRPAIELQQRAAHQTSSRHGERISREIMALPLSARGPTNCSASGSQSSGMPSRRAIAPRWQTVTER